MIALYLILLLLVLILTEQSFNYNPGLSSYQPTPNIPAPHIVHIGLIVERKEREDLYPDVANLAKEHIRDQKNVLLRWTVIEIINRTISNSPREAVQEVCELLQRGVSAIIFPGPSHLVTTVADIANSYNIPVIAPTATDPFLIHPIFRPYLLQMPPTDTHQSEAIAAILDRYGWIYFSILTSYDSYGINGMLRLQQIASDKKWKILNTQHFVVPKDTSQLNVDIELDVIKKSEARIIVLNCQAGAANRVLIAAENKGLVGDGYMWIVTDGVVGNQDDLTQGRSTWKEWNGLLGTLPSYKNENEDDELDKYMIFKKSYEAKFNNTRRMKQYDLNKNPFAAMVYDSVFIFAWALHNYLIRGNELREVKIVCINKKCKDEAELKGKGPRAIEIWENGEQFFRYLTQVEYDGASRNYKFNSSGESLNLKYSIMNFKEQRQFFEVGEFELEEGSMKQPRIKENGENIIFMGKDPRQQPEYQPMTLQNRTLILGINKEFPFISEMVVNCSYWNCTKITPLDGVLLEEDCTEMEYQICAHKACDLHNSACNISTPEHGTLHCQGIKCEQCNNTENCFLCGAGWLEKVEDCTGCEGNGCFNGYCIDLVRKISEKLKFNYKFVLPRDNRWGGVNPNYTTGWDGLVHDLLTGFIDISTVHFSINAAREKSIDFSVPFMQVGLAVVVKAEVDSSNEFFFLQPFDPNVWYCVILSAFLITIIVCVYNKVSPYGLYGRKMHALMTCPCSVCNRARGEAKNGRKSLIRYNTYQCLVEEVENYGEDRLEALSLHGSLLLIDSSFLKQGVVYGASQCVSGRILLTCTWYFVIIVFSMYVANLAAYFTVTRMRVGINSVEDLLYQNKLKWGTVKSTSPQTLLNGSNKDEYKAIAEKLDNVNSADEGFERVKKGDYAFIYESALLEFMVQRTCDLVIAGEKFSKFGFAFGFPPNSPYLDLFNNVILKFRESSDLDTAWEEIKQSGESKQCEGKSNKDSSQSTSKLDMNNLSGLFTVIALGIVTSFLFLIAEYIFACFEDVYGNEFRDQNERPKNILQALKRRLKLTWRDVSNHWFIFESFRQLNEDNMHTTTPSLCSDIEDITDIYRKEGEAK
ncbi:glutamate receptor ionotropic, NMDA 1-like isoform X2 [Bolinopsis microptera]|uniref:glutamate receptor ionotropic, NMDA 1-like isoform X2 n=1 Tax=Bolinopsis microptera TaxID=2820187 RepID=UPI003079F035